ncbi:GNAT family N-acetyltransferase [Schlesneria sp. DSM 10557]|uniref:GNAT family N-acetyltransferase n=1 Tax=Schlesneria sp. DSM 10557 TaxID=3044399 RepID=UPI00359F8A9F
MLTIRPETPADRTNIDALHLAGFPGPQEARLVNLLRANGRLIASLVAELDHTIVGHVAFSPVQVVSDERGAGLAPVCVAASHRRQGIAAALIQSGLRTVQREGYQWCVVLGEPQYYRRFGFQPARQFGLFDEYGGGDAFQVLEFAEHAVPRGQGLVRYSIEFASLES